MSVTGRHIQPGYENDRADPYYIEKISCAFARQVYNKFISRKYGVEACCNEEDFQKYLIKKAILDLDLIKDPLYCVEEDDCEICEIPEAVIVIIPATSCIPPTDIEVDIDVPVIICTAPEDIITEFSYQT